MITYGMMQGRLAEPKGRGVQFFPVENWRDEFIIAEQIGLDEIEFIFDYDKYEINPLWNESGIKEVKEIIKETGVNVNSVCFDYFMRRPFFKADNKEKRKQLYQENKKFLEKIMEASRDLDIKLIEIPLVDNSSIKSNEERKMFGEFLRNILENQKGKVIFIGLETDFPPFDFREYIESFGGQAVKANYDTGNSSALGYNVHEEIITLREHIVNIHIKDRVFNGGTVKLGSGDADFISFFKALKEIDYDGSLILQAARGKDGCERETVTEQLNFIKGYVDNFFI